MSNLTGGCLCGGVRFEVTAPPLRASYCHCTRCQRRTGTAASAQAAVEPGSVNIVQGEELVRAYQPENGWAKLFCTECGSALFSARPGSTEPESVRMSAFHTDPGVRPSFRTHVASAAYWEPIPDDGLPRYEGSRPE